jgi:hypothetical protein
MGEVSQVGEYAMVDRGRVPDRMCCWLASHWRQGVAGKVTDKMFAEIRTIDLRILLAVNRRVGPGDVQRPLVDRSTAVTLNVWAVVSPATEAKARKTVDASIIVDHTLGEK